jgi:hypothetical protein
MKKTVAKAQTKTMAPVEDMSYNVNPLFELK